MRHRGLEEVNYRMSLRLSGLRLLDVASRPRSLLTLPVRPGTIPPCVSRFSVRFPTSKLSPPGPAFAGSRDCDESMDAAAGANAQALPTAIIRWLDPRR